MQALIDLDRSRSFESPSLQDSRRPSLTKLVEPCSLALGASWTVTGCQTGGFVKKK